MLKVLVPRHFHEPVGDLRRLFVLQLQIQHPQNSLVVDAELLVKNVLVRVVVVIKGLFARGAIHLGDFLPEPCFFKRPHLIDDITKFRFAFVFKRGISEAGEGCLQDLGEHGSFLAQLRRLPSLNGLAELKEPILV